MVFLFFFSNDPLEYFNREVQKRREEEANLWSTPGDPSHSEREDDRVLYSLLQARNKTRMGSSVGGISRNLFILYLFHCIVIFIKMLNRSVQRS